MTSVAAAAHSRAEVQLQKYRDILLPVETAARELDAKLLLALFAAEAGFRCHLGTMRRIQAPGFPPSIYISKSVRFAKAAKLMTAFGHMLVSWDEEGLVRFKDEMHGNRLETGALQIPRLLLSWGSDNARMWKAHPFYEGGPIAETGNPRIDLLRPELRVLHEKDTLDLINRFGDFALLNTNFAAVNHFKPGGRRAKVARNSHGSESFIKFREVLENHKSTLFHAFLSALPLIAEGIRPFRLVVRPHPSENPAPWLKAAEKLDNVTVLLEGSVVPWLMATKCLIHNGSTSAVEASVLKTPALAYCPVKDLEYDLALPNTLSEKFVDAASLTGRALQLLKMKRKSSQKLAWPALLRDNISSLDGPLASERIVQELVKLRETSPIAARSPGNLAFAYGKYVFRNIRRYLSSARRKYEEHKSKSGDFDIREIEKKIEAMGSSLGRFDKLRVSERLPGVLTINPPG